jgi:hypothetical protein
MDEQTKAAFASASDNCKQMITLSTGLLGIEITFTKEYFALLSGWGKIIVGISWVFMLFSVVAGVWTLLALTGCVSASTPPRPGTIFDSNVKNPAIVQVVCFLVGLACTVAFGIWYLAR